MKLDLPLTPQKRMDPKGLRDLKVKSKTQQVVRENTDGFLMTCVGEGFWIIIQNLDTIKDYINMNKKLKPKTSADKCKNDYKQSQKTNWKKTFANISQIMI